MSTKDSPASRAQRLPALVVRQFRLAAHYYPASFGALPAFAGATSDQFSLELGEAAQDRQHQPAVRCGRVRPGIPQRFESGALVGDRAEHVQKIARRARRSRRVTTSTSPSPRCAIRRDSCLRSDLAPLIFSW